MKKTKIVATISAHKCTEESIRSLIEAGMNVVRINTAHLDTAEAQRIVETVRRVDASIPVMLDTKGPEVRITGIDARYGDSLSFRAGDTVEVYGSDGSDECTAGRLYFNVPSIVGDIPVGSRILMADGEAELVVENNNGCYLVCRFVGDAVIRPRKSVNIPGVRIDLPSVTDKDRRFIEWATEHDVDFIAHSFVRSKRDIDAVRQILDSRGSDIKIISKIENSDGLSDIDSIIEASYGIMVARGDLGVELSAEEIPVAQRMIVEKCIKAKRPVIIATQMLYSMIRSPRPTRAEVSDVANAIYERVDAVMLSEETAVGDYPAEAVATMARIAERIERDENRFAPIIDLDMVSVGHEITAQIARAAVRACADMPIRYVVADTMSGRTGRYIAAFRGRREVIAVCYTRHAQRILALSFGVVPILCRPAADDRYRFLRDAMDFISQSAPLGDDDLIAAVGGSFGSERGASYVEIARAADIRRRNELQPNNGATA